MKFITKIIALFAVTAVYSHSISNDMNKRSDSQSILDIFKECDEAIMKECDIFSEIKKDNLETICTTFKSEKCQKLMTDGVSSIAACSNLTDTLLALKIEILKLQKASIEFLCVKDEKGKSCPFVEYELENSSMLKFNLSDFQTTTEKKESSKKEDTKEEEASIAAINETCKSKICTNSLIEYSNTLSKFEKELQSALIITTSNVKREFKVEGEGLDEEQTLQKAIDYLKSEECTAQAAENVNENSTSNAATMKFKSAIIVSLSLLLYIIL